MRARWKDAAIALAQTLAVVMGTGKTLGEALKGQKEAVELAANIFKEFGCDPPKRRTKRNAK